MFYFPIVELIEKLLKWAKEQGGAVYWLWLLTCGISGAVFMGVWAISSFAAAKLHLALFVIIWLGGTPIVYFFEERQKRVDK